MMQAAWSRETFHERLLAKRRSYHTEHPFEVLMNTGKLSKAQLQCWVANRFYYQMMIPRKDAAILANCPERQVRRLWLERLLDQDGHGDDEGGLEAWLQLGDGVGLRREELLTQKHVLPGVRFAVDAYFNFARTAPWQEAVCASLTELFAGDAHRRRLESFPRHYSFVPEASLSYFKKRLHEVRRDVEHGLNITLDHFTTRAGQERALEILQFKLDVLWAMLDAIYMASVTGHNASIAVTTVCGGLANQSPTANNMENV